MTVFRVVTTGLSTFPCVAAPPVFVTGAGRLPVTPLVRLPTRLVTGANGLPAGVSPAGMASTVVVTVFNVVTTGLSTDTGAVLSTGLVILLVRLLTRLVTGANGPWLV